MQSRTVQGKSVCHVVRNPAGQAKVEPGSIANLQRLSEFLNSPSSWSLTLPSSSKVVLTDVSDNGWGGGGAVVRDIMQPDSHRRLGGGMLLTESEVILYTSNSNAKELSAVFLALLSARTTATYPCTVFCTDKMSH